MSGDNMQLVPDDGATLELQASYATGLAQKEIEAAVILAKRFTRNELGCYQNVLAALDNFNFSDDAVYSYPRGKTDDGQPNQVEGPSVYLAREIAKHWGNMRYGAMLVGESNEGDVPTIIGRGYAWELEKNLFESEDFRVPKLIQRKEGGKTIWKAPNERDLRETINKYAAIATRNCILRLIRQDYIRDFVDKAKAVIAKGVSEDPEKWKKKIVASFGEISVSVPMIEEYLGHPLAQASPAEVAKLRAMWKSIHDGNSTWAESAPPKPETGQKKGPGSIGLDSLKPAASQDRGTKADPGPKKVTKDDISKVLGDKSGKGQAGSTPAAASTVSGGQEAGDGPKGSGEQSGKSRPEEPPTEEEMNAAMKAAMDREAAEAGEEPPARHSKAGQDQGGFNFGGR